MWASRAASRSGLVVKLGLPSLCIVAGVTGLGLAGSTKAAPNPPNADLVAKGYEIFNREWMPNDARSHGGDGLGPVYNDTSCVACHNAGGGGGGGPVSKNIDILNVSVNILGIPANADAKPTEAVSGISLNRDTLLDFHPGFRQGRSVVLHKFGTDPSYASWRNRATQQPDTPNIGIDFDFTVPPATASGEVDTASAQASPGKKAEPDTSRAMEQMQRVRAAMLKELPSKAQTAKIIGNALVTRSQRNPTALFGLGAIDSIPMSAIEAILKDQVKNTPEVQGRISRLKDGRVGRLGWKGQVANIEDFVLNACAVEVGLEVPGHAQAVSPQAPKYRSTGLDLSGDECDALIAYVRSLPQPTERQPLTGAESKHIRGGRTLFASVGCASCHAPNVGDVKGIYSDLMLHDMGDDGADDGSYTDDGSDGDDPFGPDSPIASTDGKAPAHGTIPKAAAPRGANRREWRTPPLWGFRDSGPYLHDGRAQTLEQAVAMHGGQGAASAVNFFNLSPSERLQVEAFLKSLVAPNPSLLASRGE